MSNPADPLDRKALLKNALVALDEMQAKLDAMQRAQHEPVAIIGIGCRFPGGANDPEAYWRLLIEGGNAVRGVPPERWNTHDFDELDADLKVAWYGGFLDGIDQFDPHFFGISPREANSMDPQQRLVLEVAWEALEAAGQAPDRLAGTQTGVFVGITTNDYSQLLRQAGPGQMDAYAATGSALNAAAGRLAYTLGLQGPCMAVDTACSSSLVAIHLACQSLRNGECNLAIAGGVNAILTPEAFICFARWGMMAPDGQCKTFDVRADGFVRSEGCGMVVLKRLADAEAEGDNILAVIRGSAVNQDGRSSGLTVPNGLAQQAVVRQALADAGAMPTDINYVETHGTGTALGDPIEVEALGAVLGEGRAPNHALTIGSVKTNLGHLESASGVAGLIKLVLSLQKELIPPHLHFRERSPKIPWPAFPVEIPTQPKPWPRRDRPRLAGVSSFGFSGTNAHLVVGEAPVRPPVANGVERPLRLLAISAKSEQALRELAGRYGDHLARHEELSLDDLAYTAHTGRAHFAHRAAITARSNEELQARLMAIAAGESPEEVSLGRSGRGEHPRIAFLFTGQGSQYVGMGRQLYETQPTFRRTLDRCDELLRPHMDQPLLSVLFAAQEQESASLLDDTTCSQPALFAIEFALANLWQAWGIQPSAVLGHSLGEYVAATLAGVFSLEDGLKLIAARGRLMGSLPAGGAMAAVFAGEDRVVAVLQPLAEAVSIAATNGPENTVISGTGTAVAQALSRLAGQGIQARPLNVSHAFHSRLMDPILEDFERIAESMQFKEPRLRLISNLSGAEAGSEVLRPAYWRQHIRQPVRFAQGVETLYNLGYRLFLEAGPHPTLIGMAQPCLPEGEGALLWLPSLRRGRPDWQQMLDSVAALYTHGVAVDWNAFEDDYAHRRVELPTYPYQRQRYWLEPPRGNTAQRSAGQVRSPRHYPFLDSHLEVAAAPGTQVWQGKISLERFPYLNDHRVQGVVVVPATAYLEMVFEAATQAWGLGPLVVSEVDNQKVLLLSADAIFQTQVVFTLQEADANFGVYSRRLPARAETAEAGNWTLHVTGKVRQGTPEIPAPVPFDLEAVRQRCPREISGDDFYQLQAAKGNGWGPAFQGVERLWQGNDEAVSVVRVQPGIAAEVGAYSFHPALSDSAGHVLVAAMPLMESEGGMSGAFVGGGIQEARFYAHPQGEQLSAYARLRAVPNQNENEVYGDVQVTDETGALISETIGARLWYLDKDRQAALLDDVDNWFYTVDWQALEQSKMTGSLAPGQRAWIVFADRTGIGDVLAQHLAERGERCVSVRQGDRYKRVAQDSYTARLGHLEDLQAFLSDIACDDSCTYQGIIHLWSLDSQLGGETTSTTLQSAVARGPGSVLHLLQALVRTGWSELPGLWLVTRGAQPVGESGNVAVAQAPLWGFGRSLAAEHPELWRGLVDLDPQSKPDEAADWLASEISSAASEDQVAYRQGRRYVPRLVRRRLQPGRPSGFHCRPDRAYLITGGLGGLGLQVARWLVERGARHLILLGRTALPERARWATLEPGSRTAQQVAVLQALEGQGVYLNVASVDVVDENALRGFLEKYYLEGGPQVAGVVHAAGVMQYQALLDHDEAEMNRILQAKVQGTWNLHQLFAGKDVDFFVLFSSASTLLNSPLIASYAAGNAFLDALAHYRRTAGLPALSINWGFWADVGMVADFERSGKTDGERTQRNQNMRTIAATQGLQALERCLQQDLTQIGIFPMDWAEWQERYPVFARMPMLANFVSPVAQQSREVKRGLTRQVFQSTPREEKRHLLQRYLKDQVGHVLCLGPNDFSDSEPLTHLGLDSLMALELKNRLAADLQVSVPVIRFLQGPSLLDLQEWLLENLSQASLPGDSASVHSPLDQGSVPLGDEEPLDLLARLDELSEANIDMLLDQLLTEGDPNI